MRPHFKPIQSNESILFQTEHQKNDREFEYPWHYHPEYELTYIPASSGVRYVGNSIENFFGEELVLLGSNLPHCWINTGKDQVPSAVVVYMKRDFLDSEWMHSYELNSIRNLLLLSSKGIKFDRSVAISLKDRVMQLEKLSPFEKLIQLLQILQELANTDRFHYLCEPSFTYELTHLNNERMNTIYKFIEKNYKKRISLADIAARVNMTEEYFSRFFSKTMKKTFFEFLNEYKINKACKMLIESDKRVSEVCYAAGFENVSFFYKQFKKFKGCQPKNYRLQFLKAMM